MKSRRWPNMVYRLLILLLLCLALVPQAPVGASPACTVTVKYIGKTGNVHEYEVTFAGVPRGDRLHFSMTNMTGVTAAGVKAGAGWKVVSRSNHTVNWMSTNSTATKARLTVTSADPVHATRGQAFWVGGCTSTASVTGSVKGPWGVPKLNAITVGAVSELIAGGMYQAAIDKVLQDTKLETYNIQGGKPTYDPSEGGEGATTHFTRIVTLGKKAFKIVGALMPGAADANWLYSTIVHENVHANQWARQVKTATSWKRRGETMSRAQREVEAYLMELEFAGQTGVSASASRMRELKARLVKYATTAKKNGKLSKALEDRVKVFATWDATNNKFVPKP